MENKKIQHREQWSKEELAIIYQNYTRKTLLQIKELLPNRSYGAVKNKIKKIKFSK